MLLQKLETALLNLGAVELGNIWECSAQEAGRRIKSERGVKLDELAKALEKAGLQIVLSEDVVVDRGKYESLLAWAEDGLNAERQKLIDIPKRSGDEKG